MSDFEHDGFDEVFDSAYETITSRGEHEKVSGSLDDIISGAMDKSGDAKSERESFDRSRGTRNEMRARYGRDPGEILDQTFFMLDGLRRDPSGMADQITGAYLQAGYSATERIEARRKAAAEHKSQGDDLDQIITGALDRDFDRDRKEWKATEGQRFKLKELYPDMSFDEAMKMIAKLDEDLLREPHFAAAKLAASFGLPVTDGQRQQAQQQAASEQAWQQGAAHIAHIQQAGHLPRLEELSSDMMAILKDPGFKRTPDAQRDLFAAYRIAEIRQDERAQAQRVAKAKAVGTVAGGGTSPQSSATSNDNSLDSVIRRAIAGV